ncbi:MAG: transketolase [Candidatus Dormibacteraceae bacterium]
MKATALKNTTNLRESESTFLYQLAQQLRVDSIRCSTAAGSGHPTSSLSAADLMAVLLARHLIYDWQNPLLSGNDHLIFSKGHASPLCYSLFKAAGVISDQELLTFRKFGSRLQGHPTPVLPWVDVATGSLGQGMPIGVGVALAGKRLDHLPYHVWTLCGDSEMAEGSIWEGLDKAGHYGLNNFTAIVDVNRLGQRGPTELEWDMSTYARRVEAFGGLPLVIDGHSLPEIDQALTEARIADRPTVILARTIKGKGVPEIENKNGWHGKPLPPEMAERAIAALGGERNLTVPGHPPAPVQPKPSPSSATKLSLPTYQLGEKVPTRKAYGDALLALAVVPEVVALDGEVSNSTHSDEFAAAHPERFFEMWISEQALVACTVGLSVRGYKAFASTFSAFFSRAYDFIRMAGISQVDLRLVGSHAGVEIGQDGPSQMALEDIAALRAVQGSKVLYPADATAAVKLTAAMVEAKGVVFMRTTRGGYPVIYSAEESFEIGGAKLLRSSTNDQVALIGAGVTLYNCLEAADRLAEQGITARVIDLYSVKPVDVKILAEAARVTRGRLVVAEDHYPEGGLGAAVLEALADNPLRMAHCAVQGLPTSGTPAELMEAAGISADHIIKATQSLLTD